MGRIGAAGLRAVLLWSSEKLNVQPRQAPFAHHRGQVVEVGYGPQRLTAKRPPKEPLFIAISERAYSGFSRQQKTRTRRA